MSEVSSSSSNRSSANQSTPATSALSTPQASDSADINAAQLTTNNPRASDEAKPSALATLRNELVEIGQRKVPETVTGISRFFASISLYFSKKEAREQSIENFIKTQIQNATEVQLEIAKSKTQLYLKNLERTNDICAQEFNQLDREITNSHSQVDTLLNQTNKAAVIPLIGDGRISQLETAQKELLAAMETAKSNHTHNKTSTLRDIQVKLENIKAAIHFLRQDVERHRPKNAITKSYMQQLNDAQRGVEMTLKPLNSVQYNVKLHNIEAVQNQHELIVTAKYALNTLLGVDITFTST